MVNILLPSPWLLWTDVTEVVKKEFQPSCSEYTNPLLVTSLNGVHYKQILSLRHVVQINKVQSTKSGHFWLYWMQSACVFSNSSLLYESPLDDTDVHDNLGFSSCVLLLSNITHCVFDRCVWITAPFIRA